MIAATRRGSTLALVVWTLAVLGALSLGVTSRTRSAVALASNARAALSARYAAESGIVLAVHAIEDSLVSGMDSAQRLTMLNTLARAQFAVTDGGFGDTRMAVAVEDVGSKLDLNFAYVESIAELLASYGNATAARRTAVAIRAHIGSGLTPVTPALPDESFTNALSPSLPPPRSSSSSATFRGATSRISATEAIGGGRMGAARFLTSLDELMRIPDVDQPLIARAAGDLTVDGDGTTNRLTASAPVLRAARGALSDAPSRLRLVSRGWLDGHTLTHEIEAVYAIEGERLALVRWRERSR
ncbi:MAG: hypothetical protein ACT4R6_04920 [Gemmatimonadaceae bacterium]